VLGDSRLEALRAGGTGGRRWRRLAGSSGSDTDVVHAAFSPGAVLIGHAAELDSGRRRGRDTTSKSWGGESEDCESSVEDHFDWFDCGFVFVLQKIDKRREWTERSRSDWGED
jgi:hypothetical protein